MTDSELNTVAAVPATASSVLVDRWKLRDRRPPQTASANRSATSPLVHAFYYPWYGTPEIDGAWRHWNHERLPHWDPKVARRWPRDRHVPPEDIGSTYYPELGPYSSRDPAVIDAHMRQLVRAGVGVLAVSWYPPGSADNEGTPSDDLIPTLLDRAYAHGLWLTLHIEPYVNRTAASVAANLEYLSSMYGPHPGLYRHGPRRLPLVYVYDSYLVSNAEWAAVLARHPRSARSIRDTPHDALVLGLLCQEKERAGLASAGFDGLYTYFASRKFTYGSDWDHWRGLGEFCRAHGLLFVPSCGPGYDDTRVRPWNGQNTQGRRGGAYYAEALDAAVAARADIVTLTSFNEWHEGTQIETATPRARYPDYGASGEGAFLDQTARWVRANADALQLRSAEGGAEGGEAIKAGPVDAAALQHHKAHKRPPKRMRRVAFIPSHHSHKGVAVG